MGEVSYRTPETQEQALTLALYLGLIAPDDGKAETAALLAEDLAAGLDAGTVEVCKAAASEQAEAAGF